MLSLADKAAGEIRACLARSVESIIEVGRKLAEWKEALPHGQWGRMFSDSDSPVAEPLPFSSRTAQRFIAIAEHPALANPTHVSYLPPAWGTLAELAALPPDEVEQGIASGAITAEMRRADAERLAGKPEKPKPAPKPVAAPRPVPAPTDDEGDEPAPAPRQPEPEPLPPAAAEVIDVDGNGEVVPEEMAALWALLRVRAPDLARAMDSLTRQWAALQEEAESASPGGGRRALPSGAVRVIGNAIRPLKEAAQRARSLVPHAMHGKCDGMGCPGCGHSGWLGAKQEKHEQRRDKKAQEAVIS